MCIYRTDDGKCKKFSDDKTISYCVNAPCEYEKLSKYDQIMNMSIDELAEAIYSSDIERCHFCKNNLCTVIKDNCIEGIKKWLESEVE